MSESTFDKFQNSQSDYEKFQKTESTDQKLQDSKAPETTSAHKQLQDSKGFAEAGFEKAQRLQTERKEALKAAGARWARDGLGLKGAAAEKAGKDFERKPVKMQRRIIGSLDLAEAAAKEFVEAVEGGSGGKPQPKPFQLVPFKDGATEKVKVMASTLAGYAPTVPTPAADGSYLFTPSGTGYIYGKVVIKETTGAWVSSSLVLLTSAPADTSTDFHVLIGRSIASGSAPVEVLNYRYGPIPYFVCRNWYSNTAPFFTVYFT